MLLSAGVLIAWIVFYQTKGNVCASGGRTVEESLSESSWESDQDGARLAVGLMGTNAVEPLRNILNARPPTRELWLSQRIPWAFRLLQRRLQKTNLKHHALSCIESAGTLGDSLTPEVIQIAANTNELLETRLRALRCLHSRMTENPTIEKALGRLSTDPIIGTHASLMLLGLQKDKEAKRIRELRGEMDSIATVGSAATEISFTNSLFSNQPFTLQK